MPRDGSNVYTRPFPDVEPSTTIESAVYNGFTADVATDLNAPRPIVAGGTGATNALDAMVALKGEISQQVVTNYDSYAFVSGSFSSAAGATGAPSANAFSGLVYVADSNNMVVEARDVTTGLKYIRRKVAGVWANSGAWAADSLQVAGRQTTAGGFKFTTAIITLTGTVVPDAFLGNYQAGNNAGAFTLAAPTADSALDLLVTNTSTAGAITFSGYTVSATNTGDLLTTTNGHLFIISIRRISGISTYVIKALQ